MEILKKAEQKRKRCIARLKHFKGIVSSETPEKCIVLCNVGQATGMERSKLIPTIQKIAPGIPLPKYLTPKGESFSFLVFDNENNARSFYEKCEGIIKLDIDGSKHGDFIYMVYTKNVPSDEIIYDSITPKGLHIFEDFITVEEETLLINLFDLTTEISTGSLKNREVCHYGYEFRYGSNDVDLNAPLVEKIPEECDFLWPRLKNLGIQFSAHPDQLTVNKYSPGQGIPSHVDKHSPFDHMILSLSLGSSVVMDWKTTAQYTPLNVPARSMLVMTDEARYAWQHGIQSRSWDPVVTERTTPSGIVKVVTSDTHPRETRWSLTFRWTRSGPCECDYTNMCDSVRGDADNIDNELAVTLENLHVHEVYEKIASHFSTTRHKPWPKVVEFMKSVPSGSVVVDLGCGNGKNILKRNDIFQIAAERSSGLLEECKRFTSDKPNTDCLRLDLLNNTLRENCADYVICIAVIHHFSSKQRRVQAISTIARILKTGGQALITVWAKDQTKSNYLNKSKREEHRVNDETMSVAGIHLPVHENRTQFQHSDLLVPWKLKGVQKNTNTNENTLLRYYHVFQESELDGLCSDNLELEIVKNFYEEGNWCVVCKKM